LLRRTRKLGLSDLAIDAMITGLFCPFQQLRSQITKVNIKRRDLHVLFRERMMETKKKLKDKDLRQGLLSDASSPDQG
jgi:hypothetical protein